ncbi:MAG: hypothetical protein KDA89_07230 [Planctomycetaceae bacterium]|nr:hypothetical protein [Planctomycetaceae bacterium]
MSELSELRMFQQIIMTFDTPAFMRRARDVEAEWNAVLMQCEKERDRLLKVSPRRALKNLIGCGALLTVFTADDAQYLLALADTWQIETSPNQPTSVLNAATVRNVEALVAAFNRFNERWLSYLRTVDLSEVNRLRDGYNRFYVLEKECAVGSPGVARMGFEPLQPAAVEDLLERFPPLRIPAARQT